MKTKNQTKQRRQARKGWTIDDDLKSDFEIVMLDDMAGLDEVEWAMLVEDDE